MTDSPSIIPSRELVYQWLAEVWHEGTPVRVAASDEHLATCAAQWGANQELKVCCAWFQEFYKTESWVNHDLKHLRAACRPKSLLSLKEQALNELNLTADPNGAELSKTQVELIRQALEQLPND